LDRSETLSHMGRATAEMGDLERSMSLFEQAIGTASSRREPYFFKGMALLKKAYLDEAVVEFERCLAVPADVKPDFHLNIDSIWTGALPQEALAFCQAQISEAKAKLAALKQSQEKMV
jgi:tetratricopeptide (TPR) repeat protein